MRENFAAHLSHAFTKSSGTQLSTIPCVKMTENAAERRFIVGCRGEGAPAGTDSRWQRGRKGRQKMTARGKDVEDVEEARSK